VAYEELEARQSVVSGSGPYEVACFDRLRNGGGVSLPRPYLPVLGTRR
jgi:hypothetical protein